MYNYNTEKEIWKEIKGYEGRYEVSNLGNIKNIRRNTMLNLFPDRSGYLLVGLYNGKKKSFRVHRIVAKHFIPNDHNKPEINHKDWNKQNNSINNLEWVTRKENVLHAVKNGLYTLEENTNARNNKVNKKQVAEIRKRYGEGGISQVRLGKEYGLKKSAINDLLNYKTWKQI